MFLISLQSPFGFQLRDFFYIMVCSKCSSYPCNLPSGSSWGISFILWYVWKCSSYPYNLPSGSSWGISFILWYVWNAPHILTISLWDPAERFLLYCGVFEMVLTSLQSRFGVQLRDLFYIADAKNLYLICKVLFPYLSLTSSPSFYSSFISILKSLQLL